MKRRSASSRVLLGIFVLFLWTNGTGVRAGAAKPNVVLVLTDDQGYRDLGCFGGDHVHTPTIDRLAAEGARLTSFYVAAPLCTPSRAALMTGCYPRRIDMATGSHFAVLLAGDSKGLHPDEVTIAEVLGSAGYATGIFGKWHLGDQPSLLPTRQGFDEYFGIPYSHDIHPYHPKQNSFQFPPLPLLEGEAVIEADPDADYLTKRITDRAVAFIDAHRDQPFFLYVPHPIPHRPLHVSPESMAEVDLDIRDTLDREKDSIDYKTRDKLFPQAIAEIDRSVARILAALERNGLEDNTLVWFTSDNGPAVGSALPLRGRKGSTYEGGMREPTVAWWPGRIPAGMECDELLTAMDLLPTFAGLAGASIPRDRTIDGRDIWPILSGEPGAATPHDRFFYHAGNQLRAVRSGPWKLHLSVRRGADAKPSQAALYNLDRDMGETTNVADRHPDVVGRLTEYAEEFENQLAKDSRPSATIENARPLVPHRSPHSAVR